MYMKLTRYKKEGKHTYFFAYKDIKGKITEDEFLEEKTTETQLKSKSPALVIIKYLSS